MMTVKALILYTQYLFIILGSMLSIRMHAIFMTMLSCEHGTTLHYSVILSTP